MRIESSSLLRRVAALDVVLAIAVTALLQAELWLGERYQGAAAFPGSKGVNAPLFAVATVALAWRRRHPMRAYVVTMGALAVESLASGGPESGGSFLIVLIAVYSAAAYGSHPIFTAAIALAVVAIHDLTDPFIRGSGDVIFGFIFAAVGFIFGRAIHGRRIRSSLLAEEARRLEAERDERAGRAVADERARIARELHDIIAHSVSLMVVQAIGGQRASDGEGPAGRQALASIESTGRQAMGEMRRLLAILQESDEGPTPPQPGLAQLPELIGEMRTAGLEVDLTERGKRPDLSPGVELALYRIAQESLTNALKHAGPTRVAITLEYRALEVELIVRDQGGDGKHSEGLWSGGRGLAGMRERAAVYGGDLRATPAETGFTIEVRLPLAEMTT